MISPLLTDLYQLTMAYGYWKLGIHEQEAVFHTIFRKQPFRGHYAVACGLASVIEFLQNWRFAEDDLTYLSTLRAANGSCLFTAEFLEYLKNLRFTGDIDAVPEGTVIFANAPFLRVRGPLIQGQLLESTLLNSLNFQTLIATKAARVCQAAQGDTVLEFGLRRAQGPDGGLSASRAAFVGGCAATSNVLAGKLYGIPVSGTHAHSWVTAFADELTAFTAYAEVMPHNCVLLVDTYDTLRGVQHAIEVGKKLVERGAQLRAIRLDSGDLAVLSIKARELLDAAGFSQTQIIASNSLDEYVIQDLKIQGAQISIWGVGTHLAAATDYPALDGVYKLSALRTPEGVWEYKLKLSEQLIKTSNPGIHQVRRYLQQNQPVLDIIYDTQLGISEQPAWVALSESPQEAKISQGPYIDLLRPIFRGGKLVYTQPDLSTVRAHAMQQVTNFLALHRNAPYTVGLEKNLYELKQQLITQFRSSTC